MLEQIDTLLSSITYRRSFHKDEAQELLGPLGIELEWHREYMSKVELADMLLDLRLEHMEEPVTEQEDDGSVQEELDALLGADLGVS